MLIQMHVTISRHCSISYTVWYGFNAIVYSITAVKTYHKIVGYDMPFVNSISIPCCTCHNKKNITIFWRNQAVELFCHKSSFINRDQAFLDRNITDC